MEESLVADARSVVGIPEEVGYEVGADVVNLVWPAVDACRRAPCREDGACDAVQTRLRRCGKVARATHH
eukprot:14883835-Heterocapsa_arctica.AAC.1